MTRGNGLLKGTRLAAGFTLMELMITMLIVAILMSVAVPSYLEQMRKGRRGEAKAILTQIANRQEQFRTEQNTYTTDLTNLGLPAAGWNATESGNYQARVIPPAAGCPIATCFQLEVQAVNGEDQWDDDWWYELWSDGRKRRRSCPAGSCGGAWILDWDK